MSLTVGQLITRLEQMDSEYIVYLSVDGEGNDFRQVEDVESAVYNGFLREFDFESEDEPNSALIWPDY